MAASKQEVMTELQAFMNGFAYSVSRMYSHHALPALLGLQPGEMTDPLMAPEDCRFEQTSLWRAVDRLYDFGVLGVPLRDTTSIGDGSYADVELFLTALDSQVMSLYLQEDETTFPYKVLRTVQTAVARHVLEGGERYTSFAPIGGEGGSGDCLSIREIALLADMDVGSVRNACNPKLPGALKTEQHFKRTLIAREEAKRWLSRRKGYVPTQRAAAASAQLSDSPQPLVSIAVPANVAEALQVRAKLTGLTVDQLIARTAGL